jgi:hypothetical protein
MSDDLIKRLRSQKAVDGRPHEIEKLTDEAAAMIEQQAAGIANLKNDIERHIANHAADLTAVAPVVDAQAIRREALYEAALRASIHSQYPVTTEYDRGYAKARDDAAAAIRALSKKETGE